MNKNGVDTISEGIDRYSNENDIRYEQDINRKLELLFSSSEQKYRIVIANFYEDVARDVLCLAYKQGFIYPRITWLFPGWYTKAWYISNNIRGNCTAEEIITAANGALGNLGTPSRERTLKQNADTILNVNQLDIFNMFLERSNQIYGAVQANISDTGTNYELYSFDSMLTLGIALSKLHTDAIEEFDYKNISKKTTNFQYMTELTKQIHNVSFSGLGGQVSYTDSSRYETRGQIIEFYNGKFDIVYDLNNLSESADYEEYNGFKGFAEGSIRLFGKQGQPLDGVILYHLPLWVYGIMVILMILSLIYISFIIVVHVIYRNKKVFKLSSSIINSLIFIGCVIEIFAVLPYLVDNLVYQQIPENDKPCWYCSMMCHLRYALPAIAKDLIFGSLIGKSLRLYIVVVKQNINKVFPEWKVVICTLTLVFVDIVYNVVWSAIEGIRLQYISDGINPYKSAFTEDSNIPFRIIFNCVPGGEIKSPTAWVPLIYTILRSILYIVGIFIAFLIRKVKIRGVNEFVPIAYATLVTIMLTFLRIFLNAVIFEWYEFALVLICLSFLLDTVLVASFLFIPKLYFVLKDPKEKRIYTNQPAVEYLSEEVINNVMKESLVQEIKVLTYRRDSIAVELSSIQEHAEFVRSKSIEIETTLEELVN